MSCHMIYFKDGKKMMNPILSREEYLAIRNGGEQKDRVKRIRNGEEALKNKLVQMNYSCLPNEDGSLRGSTRMSTTVGMDVDHIPAEEMQAVRDRILQKKDELGLLMLEESARGAGYHLVFKRRADLDQEGNLKWASDLLGVEYDAGAKDITRVFFTTTSAQLLFLSPQLFESEEAVKKVDSAADGGGTNYPTEELLPASLAAFDLCAEKAGLDPKSMDVWGEHNWHANLMSVLSIGVGKLMSRSQLQAVVKERLSNYSQTDDCRKLIDYFYEKYDTGKGFMNANLREINAKVQNPDNSSPSGETEGGCPPPMPKKLPKLINLLVSRTPDIYKPAVAHAVFPALATHLWRTRFRYIDNKLHEATLMNCLMAGTGAGKDCISEPIDHIMADIRRNDAENMKREKEWKDEINAKGANKDKRKRPEGLVIQEIDADMTNPAFVMRMAEADEHFLYVKLNEIDQFDALKGNGSGGQQFRIMCLAFDPGNRYGQTRIGTQSVTERVCIRFNWNATTTIQKGQKYFSRVLTDGPLSRINFCTIPEREIGSEIPVYGEYDSSFDEELRPYIERLCAARGEIDCPQAFKLAKKLHEECAEFSRLSQSRTYENFTFRANVIAYLKACVLYVANDYKWDKTCEDFIRWSLNYDLWCKMQFFGDAIEQVNNAAERTGTRGPRNLLELLPDTFTLEDAKRVRRMQGLDTQHTAKMIRNWVYRNYVTQNSETQFSKSKS